MHVRQGPKYATILIILFITVIVVGILSKLKRNSLDIAKRCEKRFDILKMNRIT